MLDSKMLPAELLGSSGPPPAELSGQNKGGLGAEELKKDSMIVAAELAGKDVSSTSPDSQPPNEMTRYEMDSTQQPREPPPPPIIRKQIPNPDDDAPSTTSPTSPETQVSPLPQPSLDAMSPTLTETVSLPSPSVAHGGGETQEMLMEQYTQLEARRQRILELKKIEEEQAELQAKLKKMTGK